MHEPSGAFLRVDSTAITITKLFCDVNEQDVLLFIGYIFHSSKWTDRYPPY